eukprot:CAMPEP_0113878858 /NCGR_PEP_ID=MMETSP0780_2-20120614/6917_1 /TAXON_ID=652834 /ORGANISM="Palpitomonas bilix" /LENGTH=42 /DNA_ID=CAMNT_0000865377 /DNA_START=244 /DNA_END=372 /DNA_ORIENTATION=- /assembly_acc=CAM_ASM_000599
MGEVALSILRGGGDSRKVEEEKGDDEGREGGAPLLDVPSRPR